MDLRDAARRTLARLAEQAAGDPRKLAAVSEAALSCGDTERAYRHAREARAAAPGDAEIERRTQPALAAGVPDWHFVIVRDEARNRAWEAAIAKAVGPATRVLDIGSGTGLLAMMAARAGAAHVHSCEMNPAVADAAREIVAANGLSERVTIIPSKSQALDPGRDLGGRVDLIVSEIISNNLFQQGAVAVTADAVRRLLEPRGRTIPRSADVRVALAHWGRLEGQVLGKVCGFDVGAFNRLRRLPHRLRVGDPELDLRSEPASLFGADFTSGAGVSPKAEAVLRPDGRPFNGVVQWIRIGLDEEIEYENRPAPGATSCWRCLFTPLDRDLSGAAQIAVHGRQDGLELQIWAEART